MLGTPTKEQIHSMNPSYSEFKFPAIRQQPWHKVFRSRTPTEAVDLISKLLVYNPKNRLTPQWAMAHQFFDELRQEGTTLPNGGQLPELFDFGKEEIMEAPEEVMEKLIPEWYQIQMEKKEREERQAADRGL